MFIIPRLKAAGDIEIVFFRPSVLLSVIFVWSISQKVFEIST
jgi:hypothetical protein